MSTESIPASSLEGDFLIRSPGELFVSTNPYFYYSNYIYEKLDYLRKRFPPFQIETFTLTALKSCICSVWMTLSMELIIGVKFPHAFSGFVVFLEVLQSVIPRNVCQSWLS